MWSPAALVGRSRSDARVMPWAVVQSPPVASSPDAEVMASPLGRCVLRDTCFSERLAPDRRDAAVDHVVLARAWRARSRRSGRMDCDWPTRCRQFTMGFSAVRSGRRLPCGLERCPVEDEPAVDDPAVLDGDALAAGSALNRDCLVSYITTAVVSSPNAASSCERMRIARRAP